MALDEAAQLSIQSRVTQPDNYGTLDIMPLLVRAGEIVPPWWSRARDLELFRFWRQTDHISGAISMFTAKTASVPLKIVPRDTSIKAHVKQADMLNSMLVDGSDFGGGWHSSLAPKSTVAYSTQDNGVFWEIIGAGNPNGMRAGLPVGIAPLDSSRCRRTSNPEYPVVYTDTDGKMYRLHYSRVAYASSMPSEAARMNGVGFCALSRMINTAQHLLDIAVTEQEELGSRPKRQIVLGKRGITGKEILTAFKLADEQMDNQGLRRYSRSVVIAPNDKRAGADPIEMEILEIAKALAGGDKQTSITLGMFAIALALNIPPRWIWPASSVGATKADAMYQHIAGMGGGIGHLLTVYRAMLGGDSMADAIGKPIPGRFEIIFDFQDDEQDRSRADLRKVRAEVTEKNLSTKLIDIRVARQQALDAGDLSEAQYADLELADGRLPNGDSVLTLFYSADPEYQELLALSVGDPVNVRANEGVRDFVLERIADKKIQAMVRLANIERPNQKQKIQEAMAALKELERLYSPQPEQGAIVDQTEGDNPTDPQQTNQQTVEVNDEVNEQQPD